MATKEQTGSSLDRLFIASKTESIEDNNICVGCGKEDGNLKKDYCDDMMCENCFCDAPSCIDCFTDLQKKVFWGCEECGMSTCVDCCNNDDGFVLCNCCWEEN